MKNYENWQSTKIVISCTVGLQVYANSECQGNLGSEIILREVTATRVRVYEILETL